MSYKTHNNPRSGTAGPSMLRYELTSDRPGIAESGMKIPAGTKVEYIAHVSGGNVRVRLSDGREAVMHPHGCGWHLRRGATHTSLVRRLSTGRSGTDWCRRRWGCWPTQR